MTSRALRRCAAFAASTASLAIAAVAPTTAQAGTYEMHQCADPAGVHAPIVAEWSASKGDIDNNCTAGGPSGGPDRDAHERGQHFGPAG